MESIEEEEVNRIRSLVLLEAAEFFHDSDETVAAILEEFSFRASQGLDIVDHDC